MKKEDIPIPGPVSQRRFLDDMQPDEIWTELLGDGIHHMGYDTTRLQFALAILSVRWKKSAESLWKELKGQLAQMGAMDMNTLQAVLTTEQQSQEGRI